MMTELLKRVFPSLSPTPATRTICNSFANKIQPAISGPSMRQEFCLACSRSLNAYPELVSSGRTINWDPAAAADRIASSADSKLPATSSVDRASWARAILMYVAFRESFEP